MDEKQTGLSEFFSILSEEKVKTKKDFQDKLENPASDLVNLFTQLENALTETKKISENDKELLKKIIFGLLVVDTCTISDVSTNV